MADIKNGAITITGLDEFEKKLEKLKTTKVVAVNRSTKIVL